MKNITSSFKRNFMTLFFGATTVFVVVSAHAHIPPYWMILSRTADNHGKNTYLVDQDVVFSHGQETLIVNERWTIVNENTLRLDVSGRQQLRDRIRFTYIYNSGRRAYLDESGALKIEKIPADFFEPYFHFRASKNVKPVLVAQGIAPGISLKSEGHRYNAKNPLVPSEPYVRLARSGGVVTYAVGTPTPESSSEGSPGIWIEQDQFVIRKIRLLSAAEVSAQKYKVFSGGLWLPQERQVSWGNQTVKINLSNASTLANTAKLKTSLETSSLRGTKENPATPSVWPQDEIIRDFYKRLR